MTSARATAVLPTRTTRRPSETQLRMAPPVRASTPHHTLHRCTCGGGCPRCHRKTLSTTGLGLSQPGDPSEREADLVADQIMSGLHEERAPTHTPPSSTLLRRPHVRGAEAAAAASLPSVPNSAPAHVHEVLRSPGRPLDPATRAFMEPRFDHDFQHVRVHTGGAAAQSAQSVNARAYTLGNQLVFGAGHYAPHSVLGRHLLAHELTHVVQQGARADTIQRAEIDDRSHTCEELEDSTQLIEDKVNAVLNEVRNLPDGKDRVEAVYRALGTGSPYSGIEDFIEEFPETHQNRVPIGESKYKHPLYGDRDGSGWINAWWKGEKTMGTVLNIDGLCVGSDKLGHFFQQGRDYFAISTLLGKGDAYAEGFGTWLEGKASNDPEIQAWIDDMRSQSWPGFDRLKYNFSFWQGVFGLSTTGVFSNGDLQANSAGMAFYKQVYTDPDTTFSLADYITGQWNEEQNPSCHGPEMAKLLAANDADFITEYTTTIRNLLKENRMISAYAGMGVFESLIPKYLPKYQCEPAVKSPPLGYPHPVVAPNPPAEETKPAFDNPQPDYLIIQPQQAVAPPEREIFVRDGTVHLPLEIRSGGSLSWRTNNPGLLEHDVAINLTPAPYKGVRLVHGQHRVAVFFNRERGLGALKTFLRRHQGERNFRLIVQTIPLLTATTTQAATALAQCLGLPETTLVKSLSDDQLGQLAAEIEKIQGWTEGKIEPRTK